MKKLKKVLVKIGIYASVFIAGFISQRFIDFSSFTVSKEVNIVDIFSLLVTIWLAVIVASVLDKEKSNLRNEKDLIIGKIEGVFNKLEELQLVISEGTVKFTIATASLKKIRTSLQTIYKVLDSTKIIINDDSKNKLLNSLQDLKDLITDTPKKDEFKLEGEEPPLKVEKGLLLISSDRLSMIESKSDLIKNQLLEFEIEVNAN